MRIIGLSGRGAPTAYPVLMRSESAGAPQHGQPQDWRHRTMPKGFVSERDLTTIGHVREIALTKSWSSVPNDVGRSGHQVDHRGHNARRGAITAVASYEHATTRLSPALARWLLGLGIAVTLAANIAHDLGNGLTGAAVAAWSAVALLGSYELFMMIIRSSQVPAGAHGERRAGSKKGHGQREC